jgi:hypothetical protein
MNDRWSKSLRQGLRRDARSMKLSPQRRVPRRIALGVVLVVLSAFLTATAASAVSPDPSPSVSGLPALAQMSLAPSRTAALAAAPAASMGATVYRRPAPAARVRASAKIKAARAAYTQSSAPTHTTHRKSATRAVSKPMKSAAGGEVSRARAILASYVARYPICRGATVYFGKTPAGSQGCVYLGSGTIVINPNHVSSLSLIIGHEINHLRAYRESHS